MKLKILPLFFGAALMLTMVSCGGDQDDKDNVDPSDTKDTVGDDVNKVINEAVVGEYRFSIPSPVQMSEMIKNSGATFNEDLVNSHENVSHYATTFQKALNLGVYGADLGYLTMYGVTDDALSYLSAVSNLSEDLGVSAAFNKELLTRFSDNLDGENYQDSLQVLVADAYRAGNQYLQENKKFDIIGLMLTGGFIESLYFACDVAKTNSNQEVLNRIGNQKSSLTNLIGLLSDINKEKKDDLIASLVDKLIKLENEFNKIKIDYSFAKPKTVPEKKITYITSSTNVDISPEQLEKITLIVEEIRNDIIE